jgi:hypothetical protein
MNRDRRPLDRAHLHCHRARESRPSASMTVKTAMRDAETVWPVPETSVHWTEVPPVPQA